MPQIEGPLLQREDFDFIRALNKKGESIKVSKSDFLNITFKDRGNVKDFNTAVTSGYYSFNKETNPQNHPFGEDSNFFGSMLVLKSIGALGGNPITQIVFELSQTYSNRGTYRILLRCQWNKGWRSWIVLYK